MRKDRNYVREELADLWRKNVSTIFDTLGIGGITKAEIGSKVGVSRQMIDRLLKHKAELTKIQFLAIYVVMKKRIDEMVCLANWCIYSPNYRTKVYQAQDWFSEIENEAKKGL